MPFVKYIQTEPALFLGMVEALIALAIGFGFNLTPEQFALIMAALTAVFAFAVRQQVTPTVKLSPPPPSSASTPQTTAPGNS